MLFFSQDLISYNACISACEKAGQWLQALKLLHQLQGQKLQGDVIMSPGCSFFVVWDWTGRWCVPEKRWTFQEMERVSQESAITINLTIKMFKSDGSSFNGNGVPKFESGRRYSSAISACEKGRRWERAIQLLRDLQNEQLEGGTWSALINHFLMMWFIPQFPNSGLFINMYFQSVSALG